MDITIEPVTLNDLSLSSIKVEFSRVKNSNGFEPEEVSNHCFIFQLILKDPNLFSFIC